MKKIENLHIQSILDERGKRQKEMRNPILELKRRNLTAPNNRWCCFFGLFPPHNILRSRICMKKFKATFGSSRIGEELFRKVKHFRIMKITQWNKNSNSIDKIVNEIC